MNSKHILAAALLAAAPFGSALADSGFYVGASIGNSALEADFSDPAIPQAVVFDEDDFGYKVYGGYNFDLPVLEVGVELGYSDFGSPSADIAGESLQFEPTGISAFGVAAFDVGLIEVFGKVGFVQWEVDGSLSGISFSDDGSDPAYGAGIRFGLGPIELRGEYEIFDISDTEDVSSLSAGITWYFD